MKIVQNHSELAVAKYELELGSQVRPNSVHGYIIVNRIPRTVVKRQHVKLWLPNSRIRVGEFSETVVFQSKSAIRDECEVDGVPNVLRRPFNVVAVWLVDQVAGGCGVAGCKYPEPITNEGKQFFGC